MDKQLKIHQKASLTNLYFNRFLAVRYSTALFLFLNLYWLVFLLGSLSFMAILPAMIFILGTLASFEQIKLYRQHQNRLPFAKLFYQTIFISYCMVTITVYSSLFHLFFPFLKVAPTTLTTIFVLLLGCLTISLLMLYKLKKIERNKDKHYQRILAYQAIIN